MELLSTLCLISYHITFVSLNHILDDLTATTLATVGSKSVAMFCSFGLYAVWHFMEWKSHLAL
jgi:hypothetical protein